MAQEESKETTEARGAVAQGVARALLEDDATVPEVMDLLRSALYQEVRRDAEARKVTLNDAAKQRSVNRRSLSRHSDPEAELQRARYAYKNALFETFARLGHPVTADQASQATLERKPGLASDARDLSATELAEELAEEGLVERIVTRPGWDDLFHGRATTVQVSYQSPEALVWAVGDKVALFIAAAMDSCAELSSEDFRQRFQRFRQGLIAGNKHAHEYPRPLHRVVAITSDLATDVDAAKVNQSLLAAIQASLALFDAHVRDRAPATDYQALVEALEAATAAYQRITEALDAEVHDVAVKKYSVVLALKPEAGSHEEENTS